MKYIFTFFTILLTAGIGSSQGIEAVTGINYYGGDGFDPQEITVCNNELFFYGTTEGDSFYNNLFVSDGTGPGTIMIKRVNLGYGYTIGGLTALNNKLIFADDYNYTGQLWSSDGTSAGTVPFAPVISNRQFVTLNNKLYFAGGDTAGQTTYNYQDQLWVTDGTAGGTMLVKTINPTGPAAIQNMYAWNGNLYFVATDGVNGAQLWISDGTGPGTQMLKMINITNETTWPTYISQYTPFNGKLYFSGQDSVASTQLWVTDGTAGGTNRVVNYQQWGYDGLGPRNLIVFNNKLFFSGYDSTSYLQLWSTDGTAAGTGIVYAERDLAYQTGFSPAAMTVYNGSLYMQGNDSLHKGQLWKTDGTTGGTQIVTTSPESFFNTPLMATLGDKLIFVAYDTIEGCNDVAISDGTAAGSVFYTIPGEYNTDFRFSYGFVPFNNELYYNASYFTTLDYQVDKVFLGPAGIENTTVAKLNIYPNPTSNYLQVSAGHAISTMQVTDLGGRVIFYNGTFNGNRIETSSFSPGLYLLRATDDVGNIYTNKFVKE